MMRVTLHNIARCFLLMLLIMVPACDQEEKPQTEAEKTPELSQEEIVRRVSYSIGIRAGERLREVDAPLDLEVAIRGIQDVLADAPLLLTEMQLDMAMDLYKRKDAELAAKNDERIWEFQANRIEPYEGEAEANLKKGKEFLEANAKKEGVMSLENGLQYKVLESGDGDSPGPYDTVKVHYIGRFIDGEEFDNSYKRGKPTRLQVHRVIKGWQQALTMMQEGDKWMVYVPTELAYGEQGMQGSYPNAALVFEIKLVKVIPSETD
ncbi:MAG: FKBP-type peptidyl-prolyl cis-trans isomerase [Candidatus Sumerlaeia bacterium]